MVVPHISFFKRFYEIKVVRREAGSESTSHGFVTVKFWKSRYSAETAKFRG